MPHAEVRSAGGIILQEVDFTYDVFDRRIAKTVDSDGAGPLLPETLFTVYDGHNAWADFDAAGNVVARYLFGNAIDELLARWRPTEGTAWYLTDHLGSVRDILDSTGALIDHIEYDSFGNIVSESNPSAGDRFKFTGREWDAELALYYYRARFYDPSLGRFVSQDPIGFAAGDANLYRYVGNSPLMYVDPLGLEGLIGYTFGKYGRQIANAMAGAAVGYVCGWVEAKYTNHPDPHQRAMEEMVQGFALGFAVEHVSALQRHRLWIGIALVIRGISTADDLVVVGIRTTCIMVELTSMREKGSIFRKKGSLGDTPNSSVKPGQVASPYPRGRRVGGRGESLRPTDPVAGFREVGAWEFTPENLNLMEAGRPPIGRDNLPVELHHRNQNPLGPLDEMTSTTHDTIPHPQRPSQINRSQFAGERARYWRTRARILLGQE